MLLRVEHAHETFDQNQDYLVGCSRISGATTLGHPCSSWTYFSWFYSNYVGLAKPQLAGFLSKLCSLTRVISRRSQVGVDLCYVMVSHALEPARWVHGLQVQLLQYSP